MSVTHLFVNPIADELGFLGTKPSDWNDNHVVSIENADVAAAAGIVESKLSLNFPTHAPVTLGISNGLVLAGQALSMNLAGANSTGTLSAQDWNTFNGKQSALTFPLVASLGGTSVNNSGTFTNHSNSTIIGGGVISLGGFTLTVPATGTVDLLGTAQTISAIKTFTAAPTINVTNASAFSIYKVDGTTLRFIVDTTNSPGRVGINIVPETGLHMVGVNGEFRLQSTASDLTNKTGRMTVAAYDNSQVPVLAFLDTNQVSANSMQWGGGSSVAQAVTRHSFYAAAAVNTTTGTEIMRMTTTGMQIQPSGIVAVSLAPLHVLTADAVTNTIANQVIIGHNTSGTSAAGFGTGLLFQGRSAFTVNTDMGRLTYEWVVATHASRTVRSRWTASDSGGEREGMSIQSNGSAALISFYAGTPVVRGAALTTQLTSITHTAPGTPDYAIQNMTQTTPWGFATQDEGNTVLSVILNLQTRVAELEARLGSATGVNLFA